MGHGGILEVVVGGQYGSEAKGHVAAQVAKRDAEDGRGHFAVRVAGPNAGHTAYDETGHRFAFRQLPVAAVVNPNAQLVIAAGSEIDLEVLVHEIEWAESRGHKVRERLLIDSEATVLTEAHKQAEMFGQMQKRIGSTQKGIGAARADRIMRRAERVIDRAGEFSSLGVLMPTAKFLNEALATGRRVLIEGTQGYGLGLHAGYYPKCTSSDCRAIDFISMAGVNPWAGSRTLVDVVCRVYPIRVAGDSGPIKDETTWAELGLPEERTTVTNKVRRVGLWDPALAREAVTANGGGESGNVRVVLTMLDQKYPEVRDLDGPMNPEIMGAFINCNAAVFIDSVEAQTGAPVIGVTTSPTTMVRVA